MPLQLPDLSNDTLCRLSVCCYFSTDALDLSGAPTVTFKSKYPISNGTGIVALRMNHDAEVEHLHVDLVREGSYPDPPNTWEEKTVDVMLKLIEECLERHSAGVVCIDTKGTYRLPCSKLPQEGIIESLLGVGTSAAGGALLEVEGTRFSIKNAEPYTELRWRLDPSWDDLDEDVDEDSEPAIGEPDAERKVRVTLSAEEHLKPIQADYLHKSLDLMELGLDRFVYEKPLARNKDVNKRSANNTDATSRKTADG